MTPLSKRLRLNQKIVVSSGNFSGARHLRLLQTIKDGVRFLETEVETFGAPRSWNDVRFFLHGYHRDKRELYDAGSRGLPSPSYFSDFQRLRFRRVNGKLSPYLDDKVLFQQVFRTRVPVALDYGITQGGGFLSLHGYQDQSTLLEFLSSSTPGTRHVLKRVTGGGGKGIFFVTSHDSRTVIANDEEMSIPAFTDLLKHKRYLVGPYISQSGSSSQFFSKSLNTVRVTTARDEDGVFVVFAAQRLGTSLSGGTDNLNRGGLSSLVDLTTGILGPAKRLPRFGDSGPFTSHPDSSAPIAGVVLESWEHILGTAVQAMECFPRLRYVGWDVALADKGPLILEANSYPGVQLGQIHRPLRQDSRFARFLQSTPGVG